MGRLKNKDSNVTTSDARGHTKQMNRMKRRHMGFLLIAGLVICLILTFRTTLTRHRRQKVQLTSEATRDPSVKHFILGHHDDLYMYSAIVNKPWTINLSKSLEVVVTALDKSRVSLTCCLLLDGDNSTAHLSPAVFHYRSHMVRSSWAKRLLEYFTPSVYLARQYRCSSPTSHPRPRYVTLTSTVCSQNINDYLPVIYPQLVPKGLAICAKIAHGDGLTVPMVAEWFEMQRLLGVDKVLIFNLGVSQPILQVFLYYQQMGLLEILPYELPGEPKNRNLNEKLKRTAQFSQDETLAVLDCKHRMAGYDVVLSHDLDEMVIPRENYDLKSFFQEKFTGHPEAAGFYFYTEFFILDWGPSNRLEKMVVKMFRKTREPRFECYKYVFKPRRTTTLLTHEIFPEHGYTTPVLPPDDVILHHYRHCPLDTWGTCSKVTTVIDDVMLRYRQLDRRVYRVIEETQNVRLTP